jgi:hypothetical protein
MSTTTEAAEIATTAWGLTASIEIDAPAERVYAMVSDITRMGEWSPECFGGTWISGTPGQRDARFHGFNRDGDAMWTSECQVVTAAPGREFGFTVMAFCPGQPTGDTNWMGGSKPGDMTWTFSVEPAGTGCVLTQNHTMNVVSAFYRSILDGVPEGKRIDALAHRRQDLRQSMESTLASVKAAAEKDN